jgi:hypothetical protein
MAHEKKKRQPIKIKIGFDSDTLDLRFDQIVPIKIIPPGSRESRKFHQILSSVREVGVIEPPVVTRDCSLNGRYLLLDGHLRIEALKELGQTTVTCLISTDDESYTYNRHISRLSAIQEHKMIARAIERGVSEEKIAQALDVNISRIVSKRYLLKGICPEAIELLKDKMVSCPVFPALRQMTPNRQIEVATIMNDTNLYTGSYAKVMLAATPKDQLVEPERSKNIKGLSEEQIERMENEMTMLQREFNLIEENYSSDVLNLTIAKGYLGVLLGNAKIVRYLAQSHPEILSQFQKITEMTSLKGTTA